MAKKMKTITAIDLECTCWEDKSYQKMFSEIIEIGCAQLNMETMEIFNRRSIYVMPLILESKLKGNTLPIDANGERVAISKYCTDLTGITEEILIKQGKTFPAAIRELIKYYPMSKPWFSWGAFDLKILEHDCNRHDIGLPFNTGTHVNAKSIYSVITGDLKSTGLGKAVAKLGMGFEGKPHSGKDDAVNVLRVIRKITANYITGKSK